LIGPENADGSRSAQDLYGSAEPAVTLDESAPSEDSQASSIKQPSSQEASSSHQETTAADEGLSMIQKLFFVGVILGVIGIFLRTRKDPVSQLKARNMA
jgi:hypothetical protein